MIRDRKLRRHLSIRHRISGTPERPRLCVFRSNRHMYAQLIDDTTGRVLTAVSSLTPELRDKKGKPTEMALEVGKLVAAKAKERGITKVVFDRAGYRYHGRVKAVAEGARQGGLEF
ncbi:MAG: 50S ribosomal protein L18 [candidate division WOR-3 bacterium]|nr:50S ribosomal protein L18 [candidate division WOR-3 bacterium]MCR4424397.1 50S ribosomal protein L18 [candidate division WOR-3 bacterium]MDH7518215.1 50S ribosomal protein L18 [bacterium]